MKKKLIKLLTLLVLAVPLAGCSNNSTGVKVTASAAGIEKIDKIDTYIELGDSVNLSGITTGVSVSDNIITIQTGGTYCISGKISDGQIVVDAKDSEVNLVLNGADITCSNSSPIYVKDSDKTVIALADNSHNTLSDGEAYTYADESTDEPDSAIYSKDDITFIGSSGSLVVNGNYNDGIKGKDDLVIEGGNITVNSVNDGITGKDSLIVTDGNITIDAGKDGLKSSNETDEGKGNITVNGGTINISSAQDGIQGINNVEINAGDINIVTGGGSENAPQKVEEQPGGVKGGMMMGMNQNSENADGQSAAPGMPPEISDMGDMQPPADMGSMEQMQPPSENSEMQMMEGAQPGQMMQGGEAGAGTAKNNSQGTIGADTGQNSSDGINQNNGGGAVQTNETSASADSETAGSTSAESVSSKGIKSDVNITINGGNITIDSCDDSIHTNDTVVINGGTINAESGDDGIHADTSLDINDGNINVTKSYEGIESQVINLNGGTIYVTSTDDGVNAGGGSDGSSTNGRPGENTFNTSSACSLNINGGYIYVDAAGDGLDANGSITMTDGFVIVNGPTNNDNGALDYDNGFDISGGTLISAGSSGMLQAPSESSSQNSLKIVMNSLDAGTVVRIESEDGKELLTFAPAKTFSSLVVSSPEITTGTTYKVYTGGTSSSENKDGLYEDGTYENGKELGSAGAESSVTSITEEGVSAGGMGDHGGKGGNGGMKGQRGEKPDFMNKQQAAQ